LSSLGHAATCMKNCGRCSSHSGARASVAAHVEAVHRKRGERREKGVGWIDQEFGDFLIEKKIPLNPPLSKGDTDDSACAGLHAFIPLYL